MGAAVPNQTVTMPSLTPLGETYPDLPRVSFFASFCCRLDFTVLRQRCPLVQTPLPDPCCHHTGVFIASNPIHLARVS